MRPCASKGRGGALAQLGERVLCKHEVIGSIPIGSTISGKGDDPIGRFIGDEPSCPIARARRLMI